MSTVGLLRTGKSSLPEYDAYSAFLLKKGHVVVDYASYKKVNTLIIFGVPLNWRLILYLMLSSNRPNIIVDIPSASIGGCNLTKDLVKLIILVSIRPNEVYYLNDYVARRYCSFKIAGMRGMASSVTSEIEEDGKEVMKFLPKTYLVYVGEISASREIRTEIDIFIELGYNIVHCGRNELEIDSERFISVGYVNLPTLKYIILNSSYGLNLMPLIKPFIYQDSTKVLDYCSVGKDFISRSYPWISDNFKKKSNFDKGYYVWSKRDAATWPTILGNLKSI